VEGFGVDSWGWLEASELGMHCQYLQVAVENPLMPCLKGRGGTCEYVAIRARDGIPTRHRQCVTDRATRSNDEAVKYRR
jgi:hypothetical protein